MGPVYRLTGQLSGADAKFFAGFMAKNFVAGASHPGQMEREGVTSAPGKSTAGNRPQRWRQEGGLLRHQAQFPHTPSGVQGAQVTARLKKNDGTTMACGGHWRTTPAQVKTEKTARHPQSKKVKFLHFFTLIFRADLAIVMIK